MIESGSRTIYPWLRGSSIPRRLPEGYTAPPACGQASLPNLHQMT